MNNSVICYEHFGHSLWEIEIFKVLYELENEFKITEQKEFKITEQNEFKITISFILELI